MTLNLGTPFQDLGQVPGRGSLDITPSQRSEHLARIRSGEVGMVHSWELVTAVDGPGTRVTVFLNGCPLRCLYCHNPDTWARKDGMPLTVDEVMERISRYTGVLKAMGGGVTISGGEPLFQHNFTARILRRCKEQGLHTALDTSGYLGARASDSLLSDVDLVLLDVKSGIEEIYKKATGRALAPTLEFGRRLDQRGIPIWIRFVLVPDLTDDVDNVAAVAQYVASLGSVQRVEVLPFHQMGRDKWREMGLKYQLYDTQPPSADLVARVRKQFSDHGLQVF